MFTPGVCFSNPWDSGGTNRSTLDKIGEAGGEPTWDGGAWPGVAGDGDVTGPESSTTGNFSAFTDETGKEIEDSGYGPSDFAPALGEDENYVTDSEKALLVYLDDPSEHTAEWQLTGESYSVTLNWQDRSSTEDGYIIERRTGTGGTFAYLDDVAENIETYEDTTGDLDQQYFYRIAAYTGLDPEDPDTQSGYSGTVSVVMSAPAIDAADAALADTGDNTDETDAEGAIAELYGLIDALVSFDWDYDYGDLINTPTIPSGNAIIDWTTDQGATDIHSGNYTDTTLTDEEVQDKVGAMVSGNTETGLSVTYQDDDGTLDFEVTSASVTADGIMRLGETPAGATIPATPTAGDMFLHTPTGRTVLMQYDGTNWQPMKMYGNATIYVDGTDGTDAEDNGGAVDADAFATIQYAVNLASAPKTAGSVATINVAAGTYAENISITESDITINGTLTEEETVNSVTVVAGTGAQRGYIEASGNPFNGDSYTNKLLYFATDEAYRIIDGHGKTITFNSGGTNDIAVGDIIEGATSGAFADVLKVTVSSGSWAGGDAAGTLEVFVSYGTWQSGEAIDNVTDSNANAATTASVATDNDNILVVVGTCPSSTSQNVTVYDWSTAVNIFVLGAGGRSVTLNNFKFIVDESAVVENSSAVINRCWFDPASGKRPYQALSGGSAVISTCYFDATGLTHGAIVPSWGGQQEISQSKIYVPVDNKRGIWPRQTPIWVKDGTIIDGGGATGSLGISGVQAATAFISGSTTGNPRIRNCGTGISAVTGTQVEGTASLVFSNNTSDEDNASGVSFGYID